MSYGGNETPELAVLSPERLAEIRWREQAAAKGPWYTDLWEIHQGAEHVPGLSRWVGETLDTDDVAMSRANAEFIAHARADVPVLLAEVDRLRAEREALRNDLSLARTAAAYWLGRFEREANVVRDASGDEACASCGVPVDSEPCPEHSLAGRIAALENALAAAGRSLSSFIFDSDDPGTEALGAQWLYHQVMPQADDPFAQPRAFRSAVLSEASRAAEALDAAPLGDRAKRPQAYIDGYSDGVQEVAERLEKLADEAAAGAEDSGGAS